MATVRTMNIAWIASTACTADTMIADVSASGISVNANIVMQATFIARVAPVHPAMARYLFAMTLVMLIMIALASLTRMVVFTRLILLMTVMVAYDVSAAVLLTSTLVVIAVVTMAIISRIAA
jgi:hypothetical protein